MTTFRPRHTGAFMLTGAAVLVGWTAGEIARLVRRDCREALQEYPPEMCALLENGLRALEAAAAEWRRSSDTGNAETRTPEVAVACSTDGELTPAETAEELGVSERQLRNLVAAGQLPKPRREGRRCWHDRAAVVSYRERTRHG